MPQLAANSIEVRLFHDFFGMPQYIHRCARSARILDAFCKLFQLNICLGFYLFFSYFYFFFAISIIIGADYLYIHIISNGGHYWRRVLTHQILFRYQTDCFWPIVCNVMFSFIHVISISIALNYSTCIQYHLLISYWVTQHKHKIIGSAN